MHYRSWPFNGFLFPHSAIFSWCQLGLDLNPQTSNHGLIFLPNALPLLAIQLFPFSFNRHFLLVSTRIGFEPPNFRSCFDFLTKCITALGHSMISFVPHSAIFSWCQLGMDLNPQTSDHGLIFLPNVLPLLAIQ